MSQFAGLIEGFVERAVVDRTDSKGIFDFDFTYASTREGDAPSLEVALIEQLGLKLESRRERANVLVVETVQRPTPN